MGIGAVINHEIYKCVSPRVVSNHNHNLFLVYDWNHDMLGIWKFEPVWRGLDMVCHMLPTKAHEFMDYKKNP